MGGVKLLAHSAGSTDEDLEAQVYHDITATIRAAWRDKEGMMKVINAKTTDEKVEIGRRYGKERKEMDGMGELKISCERVEMTEEIDKGFTRVNVVLGGKEGGEEAKVNLELRRILNIIERLRHMSLNWKEAKVECEELMEDVCSACEEEEL